MREHLFGIEIYRMPANGFYHWYAGPDELVTEGGDLADTIAQVILRLYFDQTGSDGFQVAAGETAVCFESLHEDLLDVEPFSQCSIIQGKDTTNVNNGIFFGGKGHSVCIGIHFADNVVDAVVAVFGVTLFDKVGIFGKSGTVEIQRFVFC